MRRTKFVIGLAAVALLAAGHDSFAQRGGRGGGGRVGGGGGIGGGGARPAGGAVSPYGAAASPPRASTMPSTGRTVVGPGGGTATGGSGSGSYTTQRGTTIDYGGAGVKGTTGGEYYNALTDETSPVRGSVDKKAQRAAWTVGDKKFPLYEAGVANLTKDETTMLVHFSKEKSQQFALVRLEQPGGEQPPDRE